MKNEQLVIPQGLPARSNIPCLCASDTCTDCSSSGDTSGDESQHESMFLEGTFAQRNSPCDYRSSPPRPSKETNLSEDNVEKLLANDLNNLSLQEREAVYDEIHGVASPLEETPHFVQTKLDALQEELIKIQNKPAYDRAMVMDPEYIQDRAFCIPFLRAKLFNTKEAAAQLVAHLEMKQELFGTHRLCRDIHISDLDENDQELLRSGAFPFINSRDRAGRAIFLRIYYLIKIKFIENWARTIFYFYMSHVRDEEVQRRGFVGIIWMHGSSTSLTKNSFLLWNRAASVADALPLRASGGLHYCSAGTRLHPGLALCMRIAGSHLRIRLRAHVGSHQECLYNLASYGIPIQALPIQVDGKVALNEHLAWFEQQKIISTDTDETPSNGTWLHGKNGVIPGPKDVLMGGKSKRFMYHPGNVVLRKRVEQLLPKYNSLILRVDKTNIAMNIVQSIQSDGGRFLNREEDNSWIEVDKDTAREKVAHAFRNQRRPVMKKPTAYFQAK